MMRAMLIISVLIYTSVSWSSQSEPLETLYKYQDLIQKVNFLENETHRKSNELFYLNREYKSLKNLVTPQESKFVISEGPALFFIYTDYQVDENRLEKESAEFIITYNLVGYVIGGRIFCPRLSEDKIHIRLKLINNRWKIESLTKDIPLAHYVQLKKSKKHFESMKKSLSKEVLNSTIKQLTELEYLNSVTVYDARLSFDTMLGLLFFDNDFSLDKGSKRFKDQIESLDSRQLKLLRNAIYAKHQYTFKDKELIKYYKQQFTSNLYSPHKITIKLSDVDKKNISFIKDLEK